MQEAIIVDIDGTLATICDRSPYDYPKAIGDKLNDHVKQIIDKFKKTHEIIILTGRDEECKDVTLEWLNLHDIDYDEVYMREHNDRRADDIVKKEIYKRHIQGHFNVTFVLEDRDRVVKMWRDIGLKCLQVNYGNF